MDEDIAAIDANTRNQKIKDFFVKFKKHIIFLICTIFLLIFAYFIYVDIQKKNRVKISEKYNQATTEFYSGNKIEIEKELVEIIKLKDKTYSPLSLYFLLENGIITENDKINKFFDILIEETDLEKEIKNLIIYKKALFTSEFESENNIIKILNPIINSDSIWKSHALYLMAEFFYSKDEKQKSKEFFNQIIILENANEDLIMKAQKRLNRDLSE